MKTKVHSEAQEEEREGIKMNSDGKRIRYRHCRHEKGKEVLQTLYK